MNKEVLLMGMIAACGGSIFLIELFGPVLGRAILVALMVCAGWVAYTVISLKIREHESRIERDVFRDAIMEFPDGTRAYNSKLVRFDGEPRGTPARSTGNQEPVRELAEPSPVMEPVTGNQTYVRREVDEYDRVESDQERAARLYNETGSLSAATRLFFGYKNGKKYEEFKSLLGF